MAGIKPGLPAQQANELSIKQLPLGKIFKLDFSQCMRDSNQCHHGASSFGLFATPGMTAMSRSVNNQACFLVFKTAHLAI